jgi:transposase
MLTWSHYKFKQRLMMKAEECKNCIVHEVTEEDTTRTCKCGIINYSVGASKTFYCEHCHFKIDRDWNGSRNIMIKNANQCGLTMKPNTSLEVGVSYSL